MTNMQHYTARKTTAKCFQVEKMRTKFGSNVKFVMMNSFSTSEDTKAHLATTHPALVATDGWELLQNKSPKVDAETMEPVTYSENPSMEWCAPSCRHTSHPDQCGLVSVDSNTAAVNTQTQTTNITIP